MASEEREPPTDWLALARETMAATRAQLAAERAAADTIVYQGRTLHLGNFRDTDRDGAVMRGEVPSWEALRNALRDIEVWTRVAHHMQGAERSWSPRACPS
jgi:hypothetical protein